ncbi:hypothetical protein B7463_g3152, partial [Scytalidium lignicola]
MSLNTRSTSAPSTLTTPTTATVTSTADPANPTCTICPGSRGLDKGAAAGIGVGAGFGGLLLGALAVFLLVMARSRSPLRRKKKYRHSSYAKEERKRHDYPHAVERSAIDMKDHLPQSTDEATLCTKFTKLSELVAQHVENFYPKGNTIANIVTSKSVTVDKDLGAAAEQLSGLFQDALARPLAIRHILLKTIISALTLNQVQERSLLPPRIVFLTRQMNADSFDPEVFRTAFSSWRIHTAFLLQLNRKGNREYDMHLQQSIELNIREINKTLAPYAGLKSDEQSRNSHLSKIMQLAAEFGIILFSEVSDWTFDWGNMDYGPRVDRDGKVYRSVIVRPALVRKSDNDGKGLDKVVVMKAEEEFF